jgi:hypothetical protein
VVDEILVRIKTNKTKALSRVCVCLFDSVCKCQ